MAIDILYTDFNADFDKTNRNDESLFKNLNSIKESIKNIVLTRKGSIPMNPSFGCGIYDFIFGILDSISIDSVKNIIRNDLNNFEPRIRIKKIDITQENENTMNISILYYINSLSTDDSVYIVASAGA